MCWPLTKVAIAFLSPQTTASFNWTVPLLLSYTSTYALLLSQNGPDTDISPPFSIGGPTSVQPTSTPQPTSYNTTTGMDGTITALPPGSTGPGATVATSPSWDTACGCTKTSVASAPTSLSETLNYTTPLVTGSSIPTPSMYPISLQSKAARIDILAGAVSYLDVRFALAIAAFIIVQGAV